MGIRLVIVDDNPHLAWNGRAYAANATFQHFAAGLLDLPGSPVETITSCVPLRTVRAAPDTRPVDPRIRVVGTAPFDGIEGYLRHLPAMLQMNRPILRGALAEADLAWIKVPASNAPLAAALARAGGVPRFGYVAGSAAEVAAGQARRGINGLGARLVGVGYDALGWVASLGGDRVVVGQEPDGSGIVTSLVEPTEIRDRSGDAWPAIPWRLRLAWAGRLAPGKGLEALLDALGLLISKEVAGDRVELVILGDGPSRDPLEARAVELGVADRIHWLGYVADRATYMDALASCDLFVFPSPAEGFPKVVLDAMAVGLPVLARPSGSLALLGPDRVGLITTADGTAETPTAIPAAIADAVLRLTAIPERATSLRSAGRDFAAGHTRQAETTKLVERWQTRWPGLPWDRR